MIDCKSADVKHYISLDMADCRYEVRYDTRRRVAERNVLKLSSYIHGAQYC